MAERKTLKKADRTGAGERPASAYQSVEQQDLDWFGARFPAERVLSGDQINVDYSHDELDSVAHFPELLVRPVNTDEVAAVMAYASSRRIPVVVRGSGTGLVGGSGGFVGGGLGRLVRLGPRGGRGRLRVVGGGIGLVGNADVIVAAEGTRFGLPEVNQGALGAATHLARLVPQHKMREMVYTAEPVDASLLASWGSVSRVVPHEELRDAALELAAKICEKSRYVIRRAKESLNGIDPVDVKRSYRYEQGFTYELNLSGVSDEARDAFVSKTEAKFSR